MVLLQSGIVPMLDETELRAGPADYPGHAMSEHVRYWTTLEPLFCFDPAPLASYCSCSPPGPIAALPSGIAPPSGAATVPPRSPFVTRSRLPGADEVAGGGAAGLSLDAFIQQADEYIEWDHLFDVTSGWAASWSTHPFPVRRVYELTGWVKSGEYDRIMAGDYVRRGEELPASA